MAAWCTAMSAEQHAVRLYGQLTSYNAPSWTAFPMPEIKDALIVPRPFFHETAFKRNATIPK
jgi:hypothetical protein